MKTILQSVAKLMRAENVSLPNLDDGYRENKRKFWTEFLVSETLHSYDDHDETTGIMRLPTGLGLMVAACVSIDLLRQVDSAPQSVDNLMRRAKLSTAYLKYLVDDFTMF